MNDDQYITITEFIRRLGIARKTAYRWVEKGHPIHGAIRHRRIKGYEIEVAAAEVARITADVA